MHCVQCLICQISLGAVVTVTIKWGFREPPVGSKGVSLVIGLGAKAPDAESILAYKRPKEVTFHVISMAAT